MSASGAATGGGTNDLFTVMTREEISELVEHLDPDVGFQLLDSAPPEWQTKELRFRGKRIGFLRAGKLPADADLDVWARLVEQRISEEYCLRVLADVSQKLASAGSRPEICREAVIGLRKLFDRADSLAIYMPSDDGVFRVVDSQSLDGTVVATPHAVGQGHVGHCAETGKSLLVSDYSSERHRLPLLDWRGHSEQPHSILTVPIPGPGQLADAVIQLYAAAPRRFNHSDIAPISSLGSLAVACDRRIRPEGTDTGERWDLPKANPADGTSLNFRRHMLYDSICRAALDVSKALRSAVRIYDPGRRELRFVAWAGEGWTKERLDRVYRIDENSTAVRSLQLGRDVLIENPEEAEFYLKLFNDVHSLIALPIRVRRDFVAILSVDAGSATVLGDQVRESLRNVARTAEAILEHFALIEDTWLHELEQRCEQAAKQTAPDAMAKRACEVAVHGAKKLFDVRACSIFTKESAADRISLAASTALESKPGETVSYEFGQGLTGWVAKERRPLRVRNVADRKELSEYYPGARWQRKHPESILYEDVQGRGTQTFLAVPLLAHGDLLGVLRLVIKEERLHRKEKQHRTKPSFRYSDEKLAERFASRLALFLQTLNYEKDLIRRADFSKRLRKESELPSLCDLIVQEFCSIAGCREGHIRLWDDVGQVLRLQEPVCGFPASRLYQKRSLGEGFAGRAAQLRTSLWIPDVQSNDAYRAIAAEAEKKVPVASAAAIPLIVQDQLVGTLTLASTTRIRFERIALLEDMATQAAFALRDAKRTKGLESEVKALQDVFTRITAMEKEFLQSRNLDLLLRTLLIGALEVSGTEAGTIRQLVHGRWVLKAAYDKSAPEGEMDLTDLVRSEIRFRDDDLFGEIFHSKELRTMESSDGTFKAFTDGLSKGKHQDLLRSVKSIVAVPIRFQDRCLGLLFLLSKEPYKLGHLTAGFLDILASFTAVAIEDSKHLQDDHFVAAGVIMEGFAHRVRNLLNFIGAKARKAAHPKSPPESVRQALDFIARESVSHGSLTADLQEATRGLPDSWDLREIVRVASKYRPFGDGKISFHLTLPRKPVQVHVNRAQVKIALERVIENSFAAAPKEGGRIRVSIEASRLEATVIVEDDGLGIPKQIFNQVFRPFISGNPAGGGLGLTIASHLIQRNGGDITFERKRPRGTTFFVRLPISTGR